jgi:hypothetical protein
LEVGDYMNGIYFIEQVIGVYEISEHILNKGINFFFSHKLIKEAILEYSQNRKNNCIIKLKEIYKDEENNIVVNFFIANSYFFMKKREKARCFYNKIMMLVYIKFRLNKKLNLDYRNLLKKMVFKSEYMLKTLNCNKEASIIANDLDNLVENRRFQDICDRNDDSGVIFTGMDQKKTNFEGNNQYLNSVSDYTDVEILDSKNSIKKKTFEKIKMKFISDLNKK